MIYHLSQLLDPQAESILRLFHRYISTRAGFAFLTSLAVFMILYRTMLRAFLSRGWVNRERAYSTETGSKEGVPVMGGILIFASSTAALLLWSNLMNVAVLAVLAASGWFFLLGLGDDLQKIRAKNHDAGFSRNAKYAAQLFFGLFLGLLICSPASPHPEALRYTVHIPMLKEPLRVGLFQIPMVMLAVVLIVNAINFADGMDGLAAGPSLMALLGLGIFAYIMGHRLWAEHFLFFRSGSAVVSIPSSSELVIVCAALMGALMGFLWHNAYPAHIFMGDSGSMFLGGVMATVFVLLKQELLFPLFGFLFMAEAVSVMIQDWLGISLLGRRIMHRAPLHENLRHMGWSEPKIVARMWILSAAALAVGLLTIKFR